MIYPHLQSLTCLLSIAFFLHPVSAQEVAPDENLLPNSDMETDEDGDHWPDGWPTLKAGASWEEEEGNHFIRINSTNPGETTMLYREIPIPAGTGALELSWKQRVSNLTLGDSEWFDARIMMEFLDGNRSQIKPFPKAPYTRKDTEGWQDRSTKFVVPENATILKFMPTLFQVQSGTLDIDDVVLRPIDAAEVDQ